MKLKKHSTTQKLRGAYYTPLPLAKAIIGLLSSKKFGDILEPSCGDGVFIDGLSQLGLLEKVHSITAVEIESNEAEKVSCNYSDTQCVNVLKDDFFNFYERNVNSRKFDLILGNPPYIRYQY